MSWRTTRASAGERPPQTAVIDLGSNSWRLVVYSYGTEPSGTWWKRSDELYEAVRIGAGLERGDAGPPALTDTAMARGLETLTVFGRFCHANALAAGDVHVFATSAIRDAANSAAFRAQVNTQTGFAVELLSAVQEAHYGYVAAVNSTTLSDGTVLDIGGGSLQLIEVAGRRQGELVSLPFGAVRMTERFLAESDGARCGRPRKRDIQRLRAHVERSLQDIGWLRGRGGRLVATGGAVRNLAAAVQRAQYPTVSGGIDLGVQGFVITAEELQEITAELATMTTARRRAVPGIKPGRADIILAAALTLETVMRVGEFAGMEATEAGLRDGIFLARTILSEDQPLFANVREAGVRNLAIQYESDLPHTEHVARLALQMHASLVDGGLIDTQPGERELLWAAAMLHDVGATISYDDHHKHSRYLILSADLPGFDPRERALIAQIARYHRKGLPKLGEWARLAHTGDEALLGRAAMILRLAEHLERGRDQSVREARLETNGDGVALHLHANGDLTLPRWSVERYGDDEAFARVFGRPLVIG
ncbi:Ppx/GppA phosphatase family protein [Conexibacter sp. DBS9H8]|uniref:Ppx/GppA phosphatase family protein n=1 Tax=Conexibacter sp. DBS9H8 TaxID=2937801 RepID=UPI00200FDEB3|nr:Ppx/GppA phosphatase family protein [Conexibacter sp. DBS9H8]